MGHSNGMGWSRQAVTKSVEMRRKVSQARLELVKPAVQEAQSEGHCSTRQIAAYLNAKGIRTSRNKLWRAAQVSRVLARLAESGGEAASNDRSADALNIGRLPNWPAMMRRSLATLYCGLSVREFDSEVRAGRLPAPRQLGDSELWSRAEIDGALQGFAAR